MLLLSVVSASTTALGLALRRFTVRLAGTAVWIGLSLSFTSRVSTGGVCFGWYQVHMGVLKLVCKADVFYYLRLLFHLSRL